MRWVINKILFIFYTDVGIRINYSSQKTGADDYRQNGHIDIISTLILEQQWGIFDNGLTTDQVIYKKDFIKIYIYLI